MVRGKAEEGAGVPQGREVRGQGPEEVPEGLRVQPVLPLLLEEAAGPRGGAGPPRAMGGGTMETAAEGI